MKHRISPFAFALLIVTGLSLVVGTASAEPGGERGKKHRVVKDWVEGHMRLGEYYMLGGKYDLALGHFEKVAKLDVKALRERLGGPEGDEPEAALAKGKRGTRGAKGERGARGERGEGGHGRGHGAKVLQMKFRAHMGAAIAAHKAGKTDISEQWAEKALELAQARDFERGVKIAERFLEEPDEVVFRRAPSVQELEKRLKMADSELGAGK